jgi:hypothetical protein
MGTPKIGDYALAGNRIERMFRLGVGALHDGRYVHWDELQDAPIPGGFAPHEWWIGIKLVRRSLLRPVAGVWLALPDSAVERLHAIDRAAVLDGAARRRRAALAEEAGGSAEVERALRAAGARRGDPLTPDLLAELGAAVGDDAAALCAFANGGAPGEFVHPVVCAILLHLWLARDGQDRAGRTLFYWSLLASGYPIAELISISRAIDEDAERYARVLGFVDSDDGDATYFVLHQLDAIERAIGAATADIERREAAVRDARARVPGAGEFNQRQLAVLAHAMRNPDQRYSIAEHRKLHDVVYETARTDLMTLAERGLLERRKIGKAYYFFGAAIG